MSVAHPLIHSFPSFFYSARTGPEPSPLFRRFHFPRQFFLPIIQVLSMVGANKMGSHVKFASLKLVAQDSKSRFIAALSLGKLIPLQLAFSHVDRPFTVHKSKMTWSLRSAADGSRLNPSSSNDSSGGTRLIKTILSIQFKILARLRELRKNLPAKLFSFLVGFYCATAFATVIGQTGDWDVLSAAVTVAVVEGIGALMYKASLPLVDNVMQFLGETLTLHIKDKLSKKISSWAWTWAQAHLVAGLFRFILLAFVDRKRMYHG